MEETNRHSESVSVQDVRDAPVRDLTRVFGSAAGVALAAAGFVVTGGWIAGHETMLRFAPVWSPLAVTDALALLLAGVAILAVAAKRARVAQVASVLLAGLASTLLAQAAGVIDPSLDMWLQTEQRGLPSNVRTGIGTAVAFVFAAAALIAATAQRTPQTADRSAATVALLTRHAVLNVVAPGAIVAGIGAIALAILLAGEPPTDAWTGFASMPAHGAMSLVVLGVMLQFFGWVDPDRASAPGACIWPCVLVTSAGTALTVFFWQNLLGMENAARSMAVMAVPPAGILLSLLAAVMFRSWWSASVRARAAAHVEDLLRRDLEVLAHAMDALRASETQHRLMVDRSQGLIWTHDLDGRLLSVNPATARALGFEPRDLVGRSIADLLVEDERQGVPKYLELVRRASPLTGSMHVLTRSGETRVWSFSNVLQEDRAAGNWVLGHGADITILKRTEAELERARDEALESARLKAEFLANMSHEIRTPMNGVLGMSDVLLETDLSEEQREYAETIRASADVLLTVVNDILDFSKIEAGALVFEKLDFNLRSLVETTVELFAEAAKRKRIELATLVFSDVPDGLCGDPGRLRQVLTNLVGNAMKFTSTGEVTVRVTREQETDTAVLVRFAINDTGIGIRPEVRARLFQPFVQADGSTSRQFGGTGLGLAISKKLVEHMEGAIGVDSAPGRGSTFFFTARFEKQPPAAVKAGGNEIELRNRRVLIVDDNATNRSVLVHYVAAWGMIPDEAFSAEDALRALREASLDGQPYDIAILDLTMPGMTGFELARAVKADRQISDVRLVLMPSFGKRGHASDARDAGIAAYLVKPVRQGELEQCLLAVVREQSPATDEHRLVTRHSLAEAAARMPLRILIAEDNPVNQKVLIAQVTRLGYRADIVADGEQALAALARSSYALVLMDLQMPVLDGYTATARLRAREGSSQHTPVIAVTASVFQSEREKCLDAGLDDYLSKPVRHEDLAAMLTRWMPREFPRGPVGGEPVVGRGHLDVGAALRAAGESEPSLATARSSDSIATGASTETTVRDRLEELCLECGSDLVSSFVDTFVADSDERMVRVRSAILSRDAAVLEHEAHTLKGSALNLGGTRFASACRALEQAGNTHDFASIDARLENAESELETLRRRLLAERAACANTAHPAAEHTVPSAVFAEGTVWPEPPRF